MLNYQRVYIYIYNPYRTGDIPYNQGIKKGCPLPGRHTQVVLFERSRLVGIYKRGDFAVLGGF